MFLRKRTKPDKGILLIGLALFFCLFSACGFAETESTVSSVSASSYFASYTPAKAIDGNLSTNWQGALNRGSWWLSFDLGRSVFLTQISIWWNRIYGSTNYDIQFSNDGNTWVNQYTGLSSSNGSANPNQ